jgi:hypothetical protein
MVKNVRLGVEAITHSQESYRFALMETSVLEILHVPRETSPPIALFLIFAQPMTNLHAFPYYLMVATVKIVLLGQF